MSNKVFVDTLFVVALINQRDAYHEKAAYLAGDYEAEPAVITDVVLLEIGNALARHFKKEAVEVIDSFFAADNVEMVHLTPQLFDRAYALYKQYEDKAWGLIDCVSFVVMRDMGITSALTFDQHFIQAGFRALMRE